MRPQIMAKYQEKYGKKYEGALDVTFDEGDWLYAQESEKVQGLFLKKKAALGAYERRMPLYLLAGVGFPALAVAALYQAQVDPVYLYALSGLAICSGLKLIYKL